MERSEHDPVVALTRCIECEREWSNRGERWRLYLTDDDSPELVLYCPACASREFDWPD
jgi:hypothetical protein